MAVQGNRKWAWFAAMFAAFALALVACALNPHPLPPEDKGEAMGSGDDAGVLGGGSSGTSSSSGSGSNGGFSSGGSASDAGAIGPVTGEDAAFGDAGAAAEAGPATDADASPDASDASPTDAGGDAEGNPGDASGDGSRDAAGDSAAFAKNAPNAPGTVETQGRFAATYSSSTFTAKSARIPSVTRNRRDRSRAMFQVR